MANGSTGLPKNKQRAAAPRWHSAGGLGGGNGGNGGNGGKAARRSRALPLALASCCSLRPAARASWSCALAVGRVRGRGGIVVGEVAAAVVLVSRQCRLTRCGQAGGGGRAAAPPPPPPPLSPPPPPLSPQGHAPTPAALPKVSLLAFVAARRKLPGAPLCRAVLALQPAAPTSSPSRPRCERAAACFSIRASAPLSAARGES